MSLACDTKEIISKNIFNIFFFKVMIAICLYFQVVLYHNIHFKI